MFQVRRGKVSVWAALCICCLGHYVPNASAAIDTVWISVADGENDLLPQASLAVEAASGGLVKATPAGYAQWYVKHPNSKLSLQVAERSVGSATVEIELPDAKEVSVIIYLEGKQARAEVVAPRPSGKRPTLSEDQRDDVLRGGPTPATFKRFAPPSHRPARGPQPPGGENCGSATVIPGLPFTGIGSTLGAIDEYDEICPFNAAGSADHVYSFTPAANVSVSINMCGSGYDTKVYIYDNVCGAYQSGTFVACNDDGCPGVPPGAYRSQLDCVSLLAGHTYFIVVDGYFGESGDYIIDIAECTPCDVTCNLGGAKNYKIPAGNLPIPDNSPAGVSHQFTVPDSGPIADLEVNLNLDHTWVGDLIVTLSHGATSVILIDRPGRTTSGFGCSQNNYRIVLDDEGTGGTIEALCSATMVSPPNYTPNNPLSAFDGMDKNGLWTINVSDNAGGDTGILLSWSLHFVNAGAKTPENEANCGLPTDTVNGGCNSTPNVFSPITCGQAYCATGAFDGATRDTDWYRVVLASDTQVTWCATAEFDVVVGVVNNFGIDSCAGVTSFLVFSTGGPCDDVCVTTCLTAGTWYLFVAADFTDVVPCGAEYNAELTCGTCPTGACCLPNGSCVPDSTSAACAAAGGTYQGDGTVCTPNPCPQPPPNDDCPDALPIAVGGTATGSTVAANPDAAPFCGTSVSAPGVWYKVMGNGNTLTASLCNPGTNYDSKINIYCGGCATLACAAGDDDFCGFPPGYSQASWCSDAGVEYLILVQGFGGSTGDFELTITNGPSCTTPPSCQGVCGPGQGDCCAAHPNPGCDDPTCCFAVCAIDPFCCQVEWDGICVDEAEDLCPACAPPPCDVICDPGKIAENEPDCGLPVDTVNGGCNSTPNVFSPIACGQAYCATGAFDTGLGLRDTDWYRVVLGAATNISWTVSAEFDVVVGIVNNFGIDSCAGVSSFLTFALGGPCDVTTVSACLPAGTWYLFVAADFTNGVPCGMAEYNATLTCGDCLTGACCIPDQIGTCLPDQTSAGCAGQGGTYQGDNSTCTPGLCPMTGVNDLCANAIPVAVPSTTSGTTVGATIDNGFPGPCGPGDAITSPGVWYRVTGTGNTLTASTCNGATAYDNKITVYCPDCQTPQCVTGIDDFCGLQAEVSWCSQAGANYLILMHGFGGATGPFELVISEGGACQPTVLCQPAEPTGACCTAAGCSIRTLAQCNAVGGTYLGDNTQCQTLGTLHSYVANPGTPIPDNNPIGVQDVINVPDSFTMADVDVDFVTDHTWVGDLIVTITHGATTVIIVDRPGVPASTFGCSENGYDIVLDDEGTGGGIETLCSPLMVSPPNYVPQNPLSAFDGQNSAGAWTITVSDNAGADLGSIVQWSLHISESGQDNCEPRGACCIHPTCQILTQAECAAAGGNYLGDNTACTTPGQTTVYNASPALAVPDNNPTGVTHQINVPNSATIADLDVDLGVTHTWVGDLIVTITHNATTVTIVDRPGVPASTFGCSQDNYNIIVDDEGAGGPIEALCNALMVSPPNYVPNNPLSVFDGMNSSGAWTITISDLAGGDVGTLDTWSLHVTTAGSSTCVFDGACCDRGTGCCTNDVLQANCSGPNQNWYKNEVCAEINPPCQDCGNGVVECNEQCDGGPCCTPQCTFVPAGTLCRASAGVCDVAESCTGASSACPADGYAAGTQCRASTGVCDPAENCNGTGPNCPPDVLSPAGTPCRASAGVCDVAEACTGSSGTCPVDGFAPSSQECRGAAGVCDVPENCTGSGAACPGDGYVAAGQVCRPEQGDCDVSEACTGTGPDCPPNGFESGNVCRDSTGPCDPQETCPGDAANCPPDAMTTACVNDDGCCPVGCSGTNDNDCDTAIPTMGEWGLAILALLLLVAGKVYFGRRDEIVTA